MGSPEGRGCFINNQPGSYLDFLAGIYHVMVTVDDLNKYLHWRVLVKFYFYTSVDGNSFKWCVDIPEIRMINCSCIN
jgi:hypothetical protein